MEKTLKPSDPNEIQFLFDLNGAKTLEMGDEKSVSRFEFYGKIILKITEEINKQEDTNFQVFFISFDDEGLKYSVKGENVIKYKDAYNFLIKNSLKNTN